MIYRLQDYTLDLNQPNSTRDTLMVIIARDYVAAIIQIPKNIPKAYLLKIMPLTWLTNYEKEHATSRPIHITAPPEFFSLRDGIVNTIFKHLEESGAITEKEIFRRPTEIPSISRILHSKMISPLPCKKHVRIDHVTSDNHVVYVSHINGHFI